MFDFKDQVVIVTGSGSKRGIGRGIANMFAEAGAQVIIADMNEQGCKDTVAEIQAAGYKADGFVLNIADEESVNAFVKNVKDKYGKIDVLVNNAGITQRVTVHDMTLADIKRIFNVNMFGTFLITKAVVEVMKERKYGRIVSLSSVSAKRGGGVFGGAHYSASKAAILGFSKNLAREVAEYGITVNCVCPGAINTDIRKNMNGTPEDDIKLAQDIPMKRIGEVFEVAGPIVFLASKEAGYITGEDIDINGGSHMD
ncbi:MAG: SDR family oxidoreductase [Quinella sp. 1Q7]|nr:SDR family oxidoreductase [Quinella sp. 1Q7]